MERLFTYNESFLLLDLFLLNEIKNEAKFELYKKEVNEKLKLIPELVRKLQTIQAEGLNVTFGETIDD